MVHEREEQVLVERLPEFARLTSTYGDVLEWNSAYPSKVLPKRMVAFHVEVALVGESSRSSASWARCEATACRPLFPGRTCARSCRAAWQSAGTSSRGRQRRSQHTAGVIEFTPPAAMIVTCGSMSLISLTSVTSSDAGTLSS